MIRPKFAVCFHIDLHHEFTGKDLLAGDTEDHKFKRKDLLPGDAEVAAQQHLQRMSQITEVESTKDRRFIDVGRRMLCITCEECYNR